LDEYANVHAPFGLTSFPVEDLKENLIALCGAIVSEKPEGAKGKYIKAVTISTTMGPGIKLDADEVVGLVGN